MQVCLVALFAEPIAKASNGKRLAKFRHKESKVATRRGVYDRAQICMDRNCQLSAGAALTTRSQYGSGFDASVVIDGDRVIGRIFLSPQSPSGRNWMWTITARDYPRSIHSRGYSATREQAMADFKAQWQAP